MNRNNTEKQAAREVREALRLIRSAKGRTAMTLEEGRALKRATMNLRDWRFCYPQGIPGDGEFHNGIPVE